MLGEAFLTDCIGFDGFPVCLELVDAEFWGQFVVIAELLIVTVAVCVMQRGRRRPVLVDFPGGGEQVVVLPEVVGGAVPEGAVVHLVAFCNIIAIFICFKKSSFIIINKVFI